LQQNRHAVVIDVVDRGTTYVAPRVHLGAAITGITPNNIATLALNYLKAMIDHAEGLAT
jgi:hypothetical protein